MWNVAEQGVDTALVRAADRSASTGNEEIVTRIRGYAPVVSSKVCIKRVGWSGPYGLITKQIALGAMLSLYPLCAFAQSKTIQPEIKLESPASPASASAIPSAPPNCSLQTPCIEDPVSGKRYQFDAYGKMIVIE